MTENLAKISEYILLAIDFIWNLGAIPLIKLMATIPIFASDEEILKTYLLNKGEYGLLALIILSLAFIEKNYYPIRKIIKKINKKHK